MLVVIPDQEVGISRLSDYGEPSWNQSMTDKQVT